MTADKIEQLSWYKPRGAVANVNSVADLSLVPGMAATDMFHYLDCYKDLQFGWNLATSLVSGGKEFPAILEGDDLYLWRAYRLMQGCRDSVVERALQLTLSPMDNVRGQINALLSHDTVTHDLVAQRLSIPVQVIVAYEKLFYNIVDRRTDYKFIADVVYPNTRIVEMYDNYLENVGLSDLLIRAGYNGGPEDVLYFAGIKKNPFTAMGASEGASRLEAVFMANGIMSARLGMMNQTSNAVGLMHARQIMQASKQGGQDVGDLSPTMFIGDSIAEDITRITFAPGDESVIDMLPVQ